MREEKQVIGQCRVIIRDRHCTMAASRNYPITEGIPEKFRGSERKHPVNCTACLPCNIFRHGDTRTERGKYIPHC